MNPNKWSAEIKFVIVVDSALLSENELSTYCREKGLYPEQIKQWREQFLRGFDTSQSAD